jgi:hypothetical protein
MLECDIRELIIGTGGAGLERRKGSNTQLLTAMTRDIVMTLHSRSRDWQFTMLAELLSPA